MVRLSKDLIKKPAIRPIRFLQFGEGGFLRAFCDWMIDVANEKGTMNAGISVVQPIEKGMVDSLIEQDHLYTLLLRGKENGQIVKETRVITAIEQTINPYLDFDSFLKAAHNEDLRFVISNTTEAGIVYTDSDAYDDKPQGSFPGKVTRFLHERYQRGMGGLVFLPCELIDHNGDALKDAVIKNAFKWKLDENFITWIDEQNIFTNTLVDRIVTGYPKDEATELFQELGYEDRLLDAAEPFALWVIEGQQGLRDELKFIEASLPVIFTHDARPYKLRKVRMLNGAHTSMVLAAFLAGFDTVGECMASPMIRQYMQKTLENEIMPVIDLPQDELNAFKQAIFERFENPFNRHLLLSIALNSVSKFRARVLPTILEYNQKNGRLPKRLTFSLAALIVFYRGQMHDDGFKGLRAGETYPIVDDEQVISFFNKYQSADAVVLVKAVLKNTAFWGIDLTLIDGLRETVTECLEAILGHGMEQAIAEVNQDD